MEKIISLRYKSLIQYYIINLFFSNSGLGFIAALKPKNWVFRAV